jgi:hypothetical protein
MVIRTVLEKIVGALAAREAEGAAARQAYGIGPGKVAGPSDQFDRRVRAIAAARPNPAAPIAAGAVQLIGMDDIQAELGPNWEAVASRARDVAERAIRQHLTDVDVYTQGDDDTYILFFAELHKVQAERKTRAIVEQIKNDLLHEVPEAAALNIAFQVADVDAAAALDRNVSVLDTVMATLDAVKEEAELIYERQRRELLVMASVDYCPIWQPSSKSVVLYRCGLDKVTSRSTLENFKLMSEGDMLQSAIADLDYFIMGRAVGTLHTALQRNARTALLIPIHFRTLNDKKRREEYLSLCERIPKSYAKFVVFEIDEIPEGTPISRVMEVSSTIRSYVNALVLSIPLERDQTLFDAGTRGIYGVALDLHGHHHSNAGLSRLRKYAAAAKAAGLRSFVHHADELALARDAVEAGIDFVDGEAIGAPTDVPKGAYRWRPTDI